MSRPSEEDWLGDEWIFPFQYDKMVTNKILLAWARSAKSNVCQHVNKGVFLYWTVFYLIFLLYIHPHPPITSIQSHEIFHHQHSRVPLHLSNHRSIYFPLLQNGFSFHFPYSLIAIYIILIQWHYSFVFKSPIFVCFLHSPCDWCLLTEDMVMIWQLSINFSSNHTHTLIQLSF